MTNKQLSNYHLW